MPEERYITIVSERKTIALRVSTILYVLMNGKYANIHVLGDQVYRTTMTLGEIEEKIGDGFLRVHRGCLVAVMAIHNVTDTINLSNGESLGYTARKKGEIIKTLRNVQQGMIREFQNHGGPMTNDEYHDYYRSFDQLPFAFTDIEMVFDEEKRAVDWIFRYGNPELARLEKLPLDRLIGNSFGSLFSNMDSQWLRSYERAVLYGGETGAHRLQPGNRCESEGHMLSDFSGALRLHPVQYFGDRICEQQIATIRSCCKSIRSKSIDWQMKK